MSTSSTVRAASAAGDYARMRRAVDYLVEQRGRNVPLREVADAIGLSEFHFQRLFTRWAGISPKRFTNYLALDYARELLRSSSSILDVTQRVGLSSPGRLHDLFVTIDAVTPGEYKSGGRGLEIDYGDADSPFGRCQLGVTTRGICWLSFPDAHPERDPLDDLASAWPRAVLRHNPDAVQPVATRIFAPSRTPDATPFRVLLRGTNFQVKVWEALLRIPAGRLVSYGDVANAVGKPTAQRAVGNAVGSNPVAFLIPCHRVIQASGALGNYGGGISRKRAMIVWEAARFSPAADAAAEGSA